MLRAFPFFFALLWHSIGTRSEQVTTIFQDSAEDAGAVFGTSDGSVSLTVSILSVSVPVLKEGEWVERKSGNARGEYVDSPFGGDGEDEDWVEEEKTIAWEHNTLSIPTVLRHNQSSASSRSHWQSPRGQRFFVGPQLSESTASSFPPRFLEGISVPGMNRGTGGKKRGGKESKKEMTKLSRKKVHLEAYENESTDCKSDQSSGLFFAAFYGELDALHLLPKEELHDMELRYGSAQVTPLFAAAEQGHLHMVNFLLDSGADIEAASNKGLTPLYAATQMGQLKVVETLLDRGANPNAPTENGQTALHECAYKNFLEIMEVLVKGGGDLEAEATPRATPLMFAAQKGNVEAVDWLLKAGAVVDPKTTFNATPLQIASLKGHSGVVELLIKAGADLNAQDSIHQLTPLLAATESGSLESVKLLLQAGADANLKSKTGFSPLHKASELGHLSIVKALLNRGGPTEVRRRDQLTAMQLAAERGHNEIVQALSDAGADAQLLMKEIQSSRGRERDKGCSEGKEADCTGGAGEGSPSACQPSCQHSPRLAG
uniref:Uncharacterized protein n=1 Tax=Chromera velia CCMP2878 TaxID=1169474 RepID=A0A0G4HED1_9ALVE|eukprot:Cvel_26714.t1-p1 / transcript=Cvel_26714.t1 / gene=Cvel_26714 / organism=Chromera_velia_CCMP2878 / gene_product=Ankyrin-1, putative / transcript_product=Ankyrin-1, putative / location=Cvel_scaffold3221:11222-13693(-) / protein_length=544 / sequence_SO=supercontig / SO=protein_coding / is_pseudo=false